MASEWVLEALNDVKEDATIGFEEEYEEQERKLLDAMDLIQSQEPKAGKDANINEDEENEV
jgi:hypothetical protein